MYRELRWDRSSRILWIRTTPDGTWQRASAEMTIEYLVEENARLNKIAKATEKVVKDGSFGAFDEWLKAWRSAETEAFPES